MKRFLFTFTLLAFCINANAGETSGEIKATMTVVEKCGLNSTSDMCAKSVNTDTLVKKEDDETSSEKIITITY